MIIRPSLIILVLLLVGGIDQPLQAAQPPINYYGIEVDSNDDSSGSGCTLREAIAIANASGTSDANGCTVVTDGSPGGVYVILLPTGSFTYTLNGSELLISANTVFIVGDTPANTIIQANASANTATYRVLEIGSGVTAGISNVTIRHGANVDYGGGVYNWGTLTLENTILTNNSVTNRGGGIASGNVSPINTTISNSTISFNFAVNDGGGVYNRSNTMRMKNSTISNNATATDYLSFGGGISNIFGTMFIEGSTISGNAATENAGAINALGGGVSNQGTMTIKNSTISSNSATGGGGGIYNQGGSSVHLSIYNSTISGNTSSSGSGIDNYNSAIIDIISNTTIANNSAYGIYNNSATITNISHTLIANNVTQNCQSVSVGSSNNLSSDGTCGGFTQDANVGTYLGSLGNNGGATLTHALLTGNPAINGGADDCPVDTGDVDGDLDTTEALPIDQRGGLRGAGKCDVGAYEFPEITVSPTSTVTEGSSGTTNASFTVNASGPVEGNVVINVSISNTTTNAADFGTLPTSVTILDGQTSASLIVPISGDNVVEPDETYSVALTSISSGSAILGTSVSGSGSITDDDSAAVTLADVSLNEGDSGETLFTFEATLENSVQGGFTVNYATSDGTATTADNDYTAKSGTLNFTGTASEAQTFSISINGDEQVEENETFTISLNTVSNSKVVITDIATGTITNDDGAAVTLADVTLAEGVAGMTTTFTFEARLDNQVQGGFTVNYATSDSTATTADNDYVEATGTLTFAGTANETHTFSVTVNGDSKAETNETFTVSLNTSSNGTVIITDAAIGTITNDDNAGITVSPTTGLITTETGGQATFGVVLNSQPTANVTIAISSSDTTEGTVNPSLLTFTPGNWNQQQLVTVTGVDDPDDDNDIANSIITGAATSSDLFYSGLAVADVDVINQDNDAPVATPTPDPTTEPTPEPTDDPTLGICANVPGVTPRSDGAPHAPQNLCVDPRQGQPLLVWSDDINAQWFNLYIVAPDGGLPVNDMWFSKPDALFSTSELALVDCDGVICILVIPQRYTMYMGGMYAVWMRAWGTSDNTLEHSSFSKGGAASVNGITLEEFNTIAFSVSTKQPDQPTGITILNGSTGRPTITWNAAEGVIWYQLWVGMQSTGATYHFQDWIFADDLGCVQTHTVCTYELPIPFSTGFSSLPADTYQIWMNSWGPGGFARTDATLPQGWTLVTQFIVSGS